MRNLLYIATGLFLVSAVAAFAHHPFATDFDANSPVTVKGVVTRIDWSNPHAWIFVDVKDKNGSVQKWGFQAASISVLVERGWKKDDLKIGDVINIEGFQAHELIQNRIYTGNARAVTLPSGSRVLSGSPGDGGPQPRLSS